MSTQQQSTANSSDDTSLRLSSFENRWKYAVFPAMLAFVILASFGFYLIYGMLQHMESLSSDVKNMTKVMQSSMPAITKDVRQLNESIAINLPALEKQVGSMSSNISTISNSTASLAVTTHRMGNNMHEMNRNISTPLSAINSVLPWSNKPAAPVPQYQPMYAPASYPPPQNFYTY